MKRSRLLTGLCITTCALTMTACASLKQPVLDKAPIQQNLLVKCPEHLSPHTGVTGKDVLITMKNWAAEYNECAARHNGLVDANKGVL